MDIETPAKMPSWFETSWFDYPVTRRVGLPPGPLRHFNIAVFVVGILYAIIITFYNVVAEGYETIYFSSTQFTSNNLWYEKIIPKSSSLIQPSYFCNDSYIKANEGSNPSQSALTKAVDTSNQMWGGYQILGFYDPKVPDDNQLVGLKYGDSSIVNCSLAINLNQYPDVPLLDSVNLSWFLLNLITSNTSIVKP